MVVGAHYDTKDIPGFVGANDGASGTAGGGAARAHDQAPAAHGPVRVLRRRGGARAACPTSSSSATGLRGSKVAAPAFARRPGDGPARLRGRQAALDPARGLTRTRASGEAARRGAARRARAVLPRATSGPSSTTTCRSCDQGVPSIDLIDFDFPCWHRRCDDMSAVSERSVDAVGETIYELLKTLSLASLRADGRRPREAAARRAARLLRGRRPRRPDRRARARAVRRRPSTCARRSSTTSTWSSSSASAARSSWRRRPRCRRARRSCSRPTASRRRARERRGAPAHDHRRHLPARDQGARGGEEVRRRGLHDRPGRPRGPRGGRGHDGRGARPLRPRRDRGGRGQRSSCRDPERVAFLTQTTLSVDETDRIIRRLRERFPNITGPKSDDICYATTNRQLAVRQMARECDLVLVIGSQQLVELEPAGRGRARPRRRLAPDRQRDPGAGGVARGQARGRHLLRRERPRGARAAAGRLLPRARHRARSPSSRSSRRTCASCSQGDQDRRWRRGRELHAVEAEARRLRLDRPLHLVEPGLHAAALTAPRTPRRR